MFQFSCTYASYHVIVSETARVHVSSDDRQCDAFFVLLASVKDIKLFQESCAQAGKQTYKQTP